MRKRREWWLNPVTSRIYTNDPGPVYGVHVREVLPGDGDPDLLRTAAKSSLLAWIMLAQAEGMTPSIQSRIDELRKALEGVK